VSELFGNWGDLGGGPDQGGGPLLSLQHSRLPNDFNPVNHPIQLSEMTENEPVVNRPPRPGQAWIKPRRMA